MRRKLNFHQVCRWGAFGSGVLAFVAAIFWNEISTRADEPRRSAVASKAARANGLGNHRYPRIATFQWGGATTEWYAKHDLIDTGNRNPDFPRAIKAINPDAIVLPTDDWNAGAGMEPVPDEWITRHSNGQKINLYDENTWYLDITDFCPKINGKRFNEALPEYLITQRVDINAFDGIATDGIWPSPYSANGDIDLDRNGVNDYGEHGEGWISDHIIRGIEKVLTGLRSRMPANKVILLNSGGFHDFAWGQSNGVLMEHTSFMYSFGWFKGQYDGFMEQAPQPHVILVDGHPNYGVSFTPRPSKNDYKLMRYLLGCVLLGDGYLSFTDVEGEHYYTKYYDEFDTDLGYPTGAATESRDGIWVRFFDLGAMILNASGSPQTVNDADLRSQRGYSGPYHTFRGGQDPQFNHGKQFASANLFGETTKFDDGNTVTNGDAIILLKTPQTIVSDIIIDNVDAGTSPGTDPIELQGNWTQECDDAGDFYTMRCAPLRDLYGFARAERGSGDKKAVFRPTIGVSGFYEIFEWHGYYGSSPDAVREGANVPYTITFAGGEKSLVVDQSQNSGRWNSLGKYYFSTGRNSFVTFNNNTNGPIMADAMKFVFLGTDPNRDTAAPTPPKGLRVQQQ